MPHTDLDELDALIARSPRVRAFIRKSLHEACEKGKRAKQVEFDKLLMRFKALKEMNGTGELFKATWDESKHPRDSGRFSETEGASGGGEPKLEAAKEADMPRDPAELIGAIYDRAATATDEEIANAKEILEGMRAADLKRAAAAVGMVGKVKWTDIFLRITERRGAAIRRKLVGKPGASTDPPTVEKAEWDEAKHPRGQPENAGQFGAGGGKAEEKESGASEDAKPASEDHAADYAKNGTKAKAFKEWFGDWESDPKSASKVVDANGEPEKNHNIPVTVYHGTRSDIDAFKPSQEGGGIFFTASEDVAKAYSFRYGPSKLDPEFDAVRKRLVAQGISKFEVHKHPEYQAIQDRARVHGSKVIPAYLSIKNPFVLDGVEQSDLVNKVKDDPKEIAKLKEQGYDGILIRNALDRPGLPYNKGDAELANKRANVWVAFDPTQIKAVDNAGTFDATDPNIRKSLAAEAAQWAALETPTEAELIEKATPTPAPEPVSAPVPEPTPERTREDIELNRLAETEPEPRPFEPAPEVEAAAEPVPELDALEKAKAKPFPDEVLLPPPAPVVKVVLEAININMPTLPAPVAAPVAAPRLRRATKDKKTGAWFVEELEPEEDEDEEETD